MEPFAVITNPPDKAVEIVINTQFTNECFGDPNDSVMVIFAGPPAGQPSHDASYGGSLPQRLALSGHGWIRQPRRAHIGKARTHGSRHDDSRALLRECLEPGQGLQKAPAHHLSYDIELVQRLGCVRLLSSLAHGPTPLGAGQAAGSVGTRFRPAASDPLIIELRKRGKTAANV